MSRNNLDNNPKIRAFYGAAQRLHATVREVFPRLTPPAPAPRDSDTSIGDPEPEHGAATAELPPPSTRWASGAEDDGRRG